MLVSSGNRKVKRNCLKCAHYYVTWDKKFPRGCRVLGFKTRYSPAGSVYHASGMECLYFKPRKVKQSRGRSS